MFSDSSEDENLSKIKEAADTEFLSDSFYNKNKENTEVQKQEELKPSLRNIQDEDDQFKLFNVTPQFQNYVAKALSKKLEEYLKSNLTYEECAYKRRKKYKNRIRLLRCSKEPIDLEVIEAEFKILKKYEKPSLKINLDELKNISISSEDVLSLKEIKCWSNRSKAPVFKYEKNSRGILTFVEPEFK